MNYHTWLTILSLLGSENDPIWLDSLCPTCGANRDKPTETTPSDLNNVLYFKSVEFPEGILIGFYNEEGDLIWGEPEEMILERMGYSVEK